MTLSAAGIAPPIYQWSKDGEPIADARLSISSISSIQLADAGSYTRTVSHMAGTADSRDQILCPQSSALA